MSASTGADLMGKLRVSVNLEFTRTDLRRGNGEITLFGQVKGGRLSRLGVLNSLMIFKCELREI